MEFRKKTTMDPAVGPDGICHQEHANYVNNRPGNARGRGRWRHRRNDRNILRNNESIINTSSQQSRGPTPPHDNQSMTLKETIASVSSSSRDTSHNHPIDEPSNPDRPRDDRRHFRPRSERRGRGIPNRFTGERRRFPLDDRTRHNTAFPNQHQSETAGRLHEVGDRVTTPNESTFRPTHTRRFIRDRNVLPEESQDQSEMSENNLRTNNFECMICCDNIQRSNPIWYCNNCYNIFHLKCAIEWCNKSIKSRNEAIASAQYPSLDGSSVQGNSARIHTDPNISFQARSGYNNYQNQRLNSVEWPCPACRELLHSIPNKYKCFCGKVIRPDINRRLTPHSCGQVCARKRPNSGCPHVCDSICHPGRCNPCSLTSEKTCFCGKLTREVKCTDAVASCGEVCGKKLNCGKHNCTRECHEGSCGQCDEIITISCYCGNKQEDKQCGKLDKSLNPSPSGCFSCNKICDKLLDCGKHRCTDRCHPGSKCRSCKLLSENLRTCPCGSTLIKKTTIAKRESCTDPVPTCENKCNRILICGPEKSRHRCQKKCHAGSCPPCKLKSTVKCNCSMSTKTVDCAMMYEKIEEGDVVSFIQADYSFNCETRCNKPKNCARHRCQNKCCKAYKEPNSELHKCDQQCNKKLACGQHNCPEPCHPGQCGDCTNIGWEELRCHCGTSVMYPPIACNAKPPVCHRPCRRPHGCGHPVVHECHDDSEKCAPCIVFVKKSCFCGADSKDSVYCYQSGYSCGRTCKKRLSCNQHTCKRVCHDNECETPNQRGVIVCSQPCPVPRFTCKHPCGLPCHGRTLCPVSDCKKVTQIFCECGHRSERIECHKLTRDSDNRSKMAMLSMNRPNQDSIMIDLSKKAPESSSSSSAGGGGGGNGGGSNRDNIKKLDCDDSCALLKRNKALAEALEIAQPDLKPNVFGEDPLRLIREATAHDYKFVASTYNSLVRVIKSAKESEKRFTFLKFNPADKLRREVIHELAHHFNCSSDSDGEEPFRHVVVRAYKNKSSVPEFTIEQLLPVSD